MSFLIDTHAHLNFAAYKKDLDEVIKRTLGLGMKIINVGSQFSTSQRAVDLAGKYPGQMYAAVGLHPFHLFTMDVDEEEVAFTTREERFLAAVYEGLIKKKGVVAVGECGIDYFHMPSGISEEEFKAKQSWSFMKQLQFAKKFSKPVIIHCRGSRADSTGAYKVMAEILKEQDYFHGVVHCYTADWPTAKMLLEKDLMISFTGIITYPKTTKLAEAVKKVPLEKMMIETDAPYLAPQIVRGQRNEPRFVQYVAARIAEIKGITYDEVVEQTAQNAINFFNLK